MLSVGTRLGPYEILAPLGAGGMGEVYRAHDPRLDRQVAIKVLRDEVARDSDRLLRFEREARAAGALNHPNILAIYDIGTHEGSPYVVTELLEGDTLRGLLSAAALPLAKTVDYAGQVARGLAAAHSKGIVHRDLKPENLFVTREGIIKILDFGLAKVVLGGDAVGSEVSTVERTTQAGALVGTVPYMSPEQVRGESVDHRSDIFSFGSVLYEMLSGKAAFERDSAIATMNAILNEGPASLVDSGRGSRPGIVRIVERCLQKQPEDRFESARDLAYALEAAGGSDLLRAALAAGQTPSPDMVAAAGTKENLAPTRALAGLAFALLGLVAVPLLSADRELIGRLPLDLPPTVLQDHAREILRDAGHDSRADHAGGFTCDRSYLHYVEANDGSPGRWDGLATGRPAVLSYWYRESPQLLVGARPDGRVRIDDPPQHVSGMAMVMVDMKGRLVELSVVPPEVEESAVTTSIEPEWAALFAAAGLDIESFSPAEPRWSPGVHSDVRAAWTGVYPERPEPEVRVEAAGYRGRPVYFQLIGEWSRTWRTPSQYEKSLDTIILAALLTLFLALCALAAFLARRNWLKGRGDRRGATRLGVVVFVGSIVSSMLYVHHVRAVADVELIARLTSWALLLGSVIWVLYMAIEPSVRRRWPHRLVSWTRLLSGGWRDPLVGRDVLLGTCAGAVMVCLAFLWPRQPTGAPPLRPEAGFADHYFDSLLGAPESLSVILDSGGAALFDGLLIVVLLLVVQLLLRKEGLAAVLVVALCSVLWVRANGPSWVWGLSWIWMLLPVALLSESIRMLVLLCRGLLPLVTAMLVFGVVTDVPLTAHLSHWSAGPTIWALSVVSATAAWGAWASVGGQSPFAGFLEDEEIQVSSG
jgi:tRNA A-37 threonylcarbamoyl transferase component Bud32